MGLTRKQGADCQSRPLLRSARSGPAPPSRPAPVAIRNALSGACIPSTRFCSPWSLFPERPSPGSQSLSSQPGLKVLISRPRPPGLTPEHCPGDEGRGQILAAPAQGVGGRWAVGLQRGP